MKRKMKVSKIVLDCPFKEYLFNLELVRGSDGKVYYGLSFDYSGTHGIGRNILNYRHMVYKEIIYVAMVHDIKMETEFYEKLISYITDGHFNATKDYSWHLEKFSEYYSGGTEIENFIEVDLPN